MLKIIEGKYKRKIIQTPNSLKIRPTSSRMRKSIFDVLSHSKYLNEEIYNTKVLDVFAGSGMMGLECLSREAIYCTFIAKVAIHCRFIGRLVIHCTLIGKLVIRCTFIGKLVIRRV